MAVLQQKAGSCLSSELVREGEDTILRVNSENCPFFPSIEDNDICMSYAIEALVRNSGVTRIVFTQKRDYEYDYHQVQLLQEIATLYKRLLKQKDLYASSALGLGEVAKAEQRYGEFRSILYDLFRRDPIAAYVEIKRIARRERIESAKSTDMERDFYERYISLLESLLRLMEETQLIQKVQPFIAGYRVGDRTIYRRLFSPSMKPDFMYVRLMANYPLGGEEVDNYSVNDTDISIFRVPDNIRYLYHITPPEFKLSEDKYEILDRARTIIAEHKPTKSEFVDPQRMRQVFYNVGHDMIEELSEDHGLKLRVREVDELTDILVRYTVGFGLIEVLIADPKVQDITINSPMGRLPMFLVHEEFEDCTTNVIPTVTEGESWATKLRLMSGRPLDEANPILDTDLYMPGAQARVSVISPPLNPTGLAYAFRRHRDQPWTLPLFIHNRMLTPLAAGLISFLVDGSRTFLIAGTRSAGKSSLLGAIMTEIMRKYRMITIEDTLELPVPHLRNLGYNIQSMKVAGALSKSSGEVSADEGIRATLRLGDSGLIIGEVRSTEARALYETMRIGALANIVADTIHGDSPYGVFDRVVNDLQVTSTSFKATDIIVVANPIRSADGLHRVRRVTQITEVGKFWKNDPGIENGFTDLMAYNSKNDQLEPSGDLLNGDSEIMKGVASKVKEWAGSWDAVWDNVLLRAKIKKAIVDAAAVSEKPAILEAGFVVQSNDAYHLISDRVKEEIGVYDSKRIYTEWEAWLKRHLA